MMELNQALKLANDLLVQQTLRPLSDVETVILSGAWEHRTYEAIAETSGYSESYLRKDVGPKLWRDMTLALAEKVSKTNFRTVLERKGESHPQVLVLLPQPVAKEYFPHRKIDWGETIDVSVFFGRSTEQAILMQWIRVDRCRFILLLGMGGIGKTALSIKVGQQVQSDFEFVVWRSLRNAPPIMDLLTDLIKFLSQQQDVQIPPTAEAGISQLLQYLRRHRCLLILDNAESILQAGDYKGSYQNGYEGYGQLFQQVGETPHLSCLIVTSRELPQGVVQQVGQQLPIRSLSLTGLPYAEGQALLSSTGQFTGSAAEWQQIIERYAGNPLALKIVAAFIREVCVGDLHQFLGFIGQSSVIFDDIRDLLEQQFKRLSYQEKAVMLWLAIKREPVSIQELTTDLVEPISPLELLQVIFALQSRALIEKTESRFTQQPVVMEYVTGVFIDQVIWQICNWQSGEKITEKLQFLRQYTLLQVQASDYIYEIQYRLILRPVLEKLKIYFATELNIKKKLIQITQALQGHPPQITGYGAGNIINLLRYLQVDLQGCDFSSLTVWQADLRRLTLYDVNFIQADLSKSQFSQNFGWIQSIAFSPDGQYFAGGDDSGLVHLWNCKTEQHQLVLRGYQNHVYAITFSPDSQFIASGSFDGIINLWDIRDGKCVHSLKGHDSITTWISFSKDGFWFASCSVDGTIKIWDRHEGHCIKQMTVNQLPIRGIAFTQDKRYLVSGGADCFIRLWDTETGDCIQVFEGHTAPIWSIDLSSDGQYIASAGDDNTVKIWDIKSGHCLRTFEGHTLVIFAVAFSPDGKIVASAGVDQTVRLWNFEDGRCLACFREHTSMIYCIAFSRDGRTLASASMDRMVKLWDIHKKLCSRTLSGYKNIIWSVAMPLKNHPIGDKLTSTIASGSFDGKIRLWNIQDGQCVSTLTHLNEVLTLAISPDGNRLMSGSAYKNSTLKIWDLASKTCLHTIPVHTNMVKAVCFSHNGFLFASGGGDKIVQIFMSSNNQVFHKLEGHQDVILSIAFSGNDELIASGGVDQTTRVWDVLTGQCLHLLNGFNNPVISVKFHPNKPILATGGVDSLKIWSLESGKCELMMANYDGYIVVAAIAFTTDGTLFVTGSFDKTVRIWDFASRTCLKILRTNYCVYSVVFSPDGKVLISSGDDGSVQVWDVETGESIRILKVPELYEGMNIHGVKGITEAQKTMLISLGARER